MTNLRRLFIGSLVLVASALSLVAVMLLSQSVFAGGAVGGGGSGSGGGGGAWTTYGYGWHSFSTSGSGPGYFRDGTSWSYVRSACSSTGNDQVIAFIVQTPSRTPSTAGVYKYESPDYGTYYQYLGNAGGNWLSYPAAKARYDSIDASLKAGFSWGTNVAWFCYTDNPVWNIGVSASVSKSTAIPGDTITWTHTVRNNGPAKTNKAVTYGKKEGATIDSTRTFASGSANGATASFTSTRTITQNDVGQTFCRATTAIPSSHTSNNRINSADACVSVPYNWNAQVEASVTNVIKSNGQASANLTIAEPGGIVTWSHKVTINGPTKTNNVVTYNRVNGSGLPAGSLQLGTFATGTLPGATDTKTSTLAITQDDVDSTICRLTRATPRNQSSATSISSTPACVTVPYDYTLTPQISSSSGEAIEAGSSITIEPNVENSGPTKSRSTEWVVTQIEVAPGAGSTIPNASGGNSATDPCGTYFTNASATCEVVDSGTSVFGPSGAVISGDLIESIERDVEDLPVGTRLCFALSVKPRSSASSQWAHTAPVCLTIGKKPKVQVHGGDLAAGIGAVSSNILTSTSVKKVDGQTRTFGSWTEYGVLTNGIVSGMGSGSGFNKGSTSSQACDTSLLTFTNAGDSFCTQSNVKGNYVVPNNLTNVAAAFPVGSSTPTFQNLSDATERRVVKATGSITISGGTIEKGDWLVINAEDQTVRITGDIRYTTDELNSIRDIPQLIIIANRIDIDESVTQIDAWLIATGEDGIINTCRNYAVDAPLTHEMCDERLTVNGPVVANSLYLRRTAGAGTVSSSGEPAEVFNLRPDAYLWSIAQAEEAGRIQSVYATELPPRF